MPAIVIITLPVLLARFLLYISTPFSCKFSSETELALDIFVGSCIRETAFIDSVEGWII